MSNTTPQFSQGPEIHPEENPVLVVGMGAAFHEHLGAVARELGAGSFTLVDLKTVAGSFPPAARVLQGDINDAAFIGAELTYADRASVIVLIATNDHLNNLTNLVAAGFRRFVIEKPLVNSSGEAAALNELLVRHTDIKIYPVDFYVQKALPLLAVAGALASGDPRLEWLQVIEPDGMVGAGAASFPNALLGSLQETIGEVEAVSIVISEAGKFGVPDLVGRSWLYDDPARGGMLLDLGTHALVPLLASGLINCDSIKVRLANRGRMDLETGHIAPARAGEPETTAHAFLSAIAGNRTIGVDIIVRKIDGAGGQWVLDVRGTRGNARLGLRSGERLDLSPRSGPSTAIMLRPDMAPYRLALLEARAAMQVSGDNEMLQHAIHAITLIDEIRRLSNEPFLH